MSEGNNTFKLSLEGNGISVNKEIDEDRARRILNILMGAASMVVPSSESRRSAFESRGHQEQPPSQNAAVGARATSMREYLDEVEARKNPDKILALASYLSGTAGNEDFSADEIKACFPKAAEKIPANYGRDFRWVISNGWIAESPQDQGRFYITKTGKKAISEKFPKELSKPQPGYLKRKKKQINNVE